MQDSPLFLALLGSAVTALSTSLGALPALVAHRVSQKTQDTLMGFSAGVMLAACSFSLIIPALNLMGATYPDKITSGLMVALAILFGAAFLHFCNRAVPHEHFFTGPEGGGEGSHLRRIWLFVFAITLHNFPEGLAVGTGVGFENLQLAMPIVVGIGLQDIPEGFVVAMALISARYTPLQALGVAVLTGLVEAAAALVGYAAMMQAQIFLPWALAFSGGAMLYVVSDEMIPESHRKEYAQYSTAGLMVGFVLMMFLDTTLS